MVLESVAHAARALGLTGERVLVAVSGGVDSTVLCHALHALRGELGLDLCVGHVNHGLRGADSDADEAAVESLAKALELRFRVAHVAPECLREGVPSQARPTLQEAARRLRYDALRELAAGLSCARIATAHTLDDQAETVVMRLLRGAGPEALGGIPERTPDGGVVRPLLGVARAEIERFARERHLTWQEDASNRDPRFARARLRQAGFAELAAQLNPRWLRAVADLAEAHRRDAEWLEPLVDESARRLFRLEGDELWIDGNGWQTRPEALARRLLRRALRDLGAGRDVSRTHLLRMLAFMRKPRTGACLELPGGLRLHCEMGGFHLRHSKLRPPA